jgi:hypothetical protein
MIEEPCAAWLFNHQSTIINQQFSSNALHCRVPDVLVQLQSQACGNVIGEHPLG